MSSLVSNVIEKTFSQSHSQLVTKTFRGIEDEIISKINSYRLRIPHVKEKLQELIKNHSNPEDCTITFNELNKVINYKSQDNLDKLMNYLDYLSELKHTIPDFFNTPYLNSVFTRNFSAAIDSQQGLLQKNPDFREKLKKLIPSRQYLGLYLPNLEVREIESALCFIILEEYLMLSRVDACLRTDNLTIEVDDGDAPQHISMFNPSFNTLVVYANEREQQLYMLFLTDVLELMAPESAEFPFGSRIEMHDINKGKRQASRMMKSLNSQKTQTHRQKYDNLKVTLPDITLDQTQRFVKLVDTDSDDRITVQDVIDVVRKNKVFLSDEAIEGMFEEIFQKRNVVMEAQRRKPLDPYEIFHAVRYKYKKNNETQHWDHSAREYRDQWLLIMKLVGIELPKHGLPPVKPQKLLCNYETTFSKTASSTLNNHTMNVTIKDLKPEILKKQYKPEANILIQNTQNIMELYMDDRDHQKHEESNKTAFQTLVNAKFGDLTQQSEFPTVDFSTQGYYQEALRLSKNPELYLNEKVNPIYKFVPMKMDYVYQQNIQDMDSLKDPNSAIPTSEAEFDDSVDPNPGSKRVTLYSLKDPALSKSKSMRSAKSVMPQNPKYLGSELRKTTLSSSMKSKVEIQSDDIALRPIFHTAFKILDHKTLKAQIARLEPVLDAYKPPIRHAFRDDHPAEGKPQFVSTWKDDIPDLNNGESTQDHRPKEILEQELLERELLMMKKRGIENNQHPWIRYFKLAPRERGFVDNKYPDFLEKGNYMDGYIRAATFIRSEMEAVVPFKLVHRSLKKTDKNLFIGDDVPSKM